MKTPYILTGYALIEALRNEASGIATEERADLVRRAAQEIEALVEENKRLTTQRYECLTMLKGIAEDCGDDDQVLDLCDLMELRWAVKRNALSCIRKAGGEA